MRLLQVSSLVVYLFVLLNSRNALVEGYCWQHYKGEIPFNAVPGGTNGNDRRVYVGQFFHRNVSIPGYIVEGENNFETLVTISTAIHRIEILRAAYEEEFEWQPVYCNDNKLNAGLIEFGEGYEKSYVVRSSGKNIIGNAPLNPREPLNSNCHPLLETEARFDVLIHNELTGTRSFLKPKQTNTNATLTMTNRQLLILQFLK